jgi:putative ABC transport system permease protein
MSAFKMSVLNKKLIRDLMHLWGQALAIALVMAAGVATLILSVGSYRSLDETRRTYYERNRFADVFAQARRAPNHLAERLEQLLGVATVETRIARDAILDIEGLDEPASARVISLPKFGAEPKLNALYLREGRLPEPNRTNEAAISETFAKANHFALGSKFKAILNGRKRELTVTGIALSPEFIYAIGPGDFVPDDRRFGVVWLPYDAAAAAFDLDGAFNDVSVKLQPGANEQQVIDQIDLALAPFGGTGAYDRRDQQSHAFVDAELAQLRGMAKIIPPIFLAVAAFLLNMTLSRIIALEREQIGLLKALGYSRGAIALHYLKFVSLIAGVGTAIGFAAGAWLGRGLTELYGEFYHFPFLVFLNPADVYILGGGVSFVAALLGGLRAALQAASLPPAVAMAPPNPVRYRRTFLSRLAFARRFPQSMTMIMRHIARYPGRSAVTVMGVAAAGALLIASQCGLDSIELMIDVSYFQMQRQDATINFAEIASFKVAQDAGRLPGTMLAEPFRAVPVTLRYGARHKRLSVTGLMADGDLQKLLDVDLKPLPLPQEGIVLGEKLARILDAKVGDLIDVEARYSRHPHFRTPVSAIAQGYQGLTAYMTLDALNAALGDGRAVSGAALSVDTKQLAEFYRALKETPKVAGAALMKSSLRAFRETMAQNLTISMTIYMVLSAIITFGVVYNSARIQLSERGRELASLRVLGFTKGEVSTILLGEIAILVTVAVPLGWLMGYGLAWVVISGLETDLYRVPFAVSRATYALTAMTILGTAVVSALIVRRRIGRLDLIAVLKTRE